MRVVWISVRFVIINRKFLWGLECGTVLWLRPLFLQSPGRNKQQCPWCRSSVLLSFKPTGTAVTGTRTDVLRNFDIPVFLSCLQRISILACIHKYLYTHIQTHVHIHVYIHIYIHTYVCTYLLTYLRAYVRTYIHTYTYTHARIRARNHNSFSGWSDIRCTNFSG
jgi:hypothetical protein